MWRCALRAVDDGNTALALDGRVSMEKGGWLFKLLVLEGVWLRLGGFLASLSLAEPPPPVSPVGFA